MTFQFHDEVDELVYDISEPRLLDALNGPLAYWCNHGGRNPPNQDAQYVNTTYNMFASIDGMGGMANGDIAARILAEECQRATLDWGCLEERMATEIQQKASARMSKLGVGGACYALFRVWENYFRIAHAGDVRVVVLDTESNVLYQTKDQSRGHLVSNAVTGGNPGVVTYTEIQIAAGHTIIAGSDGLWNSCSTKEVAELRKGKKAPELLQELKRIALERMNDEQAHPDNINLLVYDLDRIVSHKDA